MNTQHSTGSELPAIIRRQYEPAFAMLASVIENCPEELWIDNPCGYPLWKRILHGLESLDYHLVDFGIYLFPALGKKVSPEFDVPDEDSLSRKEMLAYYGNIRKKFEVTLSALGNHRLIEPSPSFPQFTVLDILLLQFRHLVFNTGCCDEALGANGVPRTGWVGYGE